MQIDPKILDALRVRDDIIYILLQVVVEYAPPINEMPIDVASAYARGPVLRDQCTLADKLIGYDKSLRNK
jgi:hypothetical protein